jgi:putative addiction module component (TIGR02574 family)
MNADNNNFTTLVSNICANLRHRRCNKNLTRRVRPAGALVFGSSLPARFNPIDLVPKLSLGLCLASWNIEGREHKSRVIPSRVRRRGTSLLQERSLNLENGAFLKQTCGVSRKRSQACANGRRLLQIYRRAMLSERILLVEDIWDSIAKVPESVPLTPAQREELDRRLEGLGAEFVRCVDSCVELIRRHPEMGPVIHRQVRRAVIRRFPYSIMYLIDADVVVVIAIFHTARDPKVWKRRA